jgi:hypothetical protein
MDDERFLNSYHNASRPPGPDVPADLAGFISRPPRSSARRPSSPGSSPTLTRAQRRN